MFVDDDEAFLRVLEHACSRIAKIEGFLKASDGEDALTVLNDLLASGSRLPDMIFVDINMPRMDGFAFLEAFAKLRATSTALRDVRPIAMLTSSDQVRDRDRATELGADDYIVKPASLAEMRQLLERFVA